MNRIELKESDFPKSYHIFEGIESKIYRFSDDTLLKVFKKGNNFNDKNKIKKLILLSELSINENIFGNLVYVNNDFIGYTMKDLTKKGYKTTSCLNERYSKKIDITKMVWERILELHELGITYGDIRENNVLWNGHDIILCDMDNVKMDKYDFDMTNVYQNHYLAKMHYDYTLLDNFIFNVYFISYYQKIYFPFVYQHLECNDLDKRLDNDECRKIACDMTHLSSDYNGELFIDYLNDTLTSKLKRTLFKK